MVPCRLKFTHKYFRMSSQQIGIVREGITSISMHTFVCIDLLPSAEEPRQKTGENRQGCVRAQGIATFRIKGNEATGLSRRKDCSPRFSPVCGQRPAAQRGISADTVLVTFAKTKVTGPPRPRAVRHCVNEHTLW
jgi:hypothetical protein